MKAILVAAVLAAGVTPVMAGDGWNYGSSSYGSSSSLINCKPNAYDYRNTYNNSSTYRSHSYGSRLGSAHYDHWSPSYNFRSSRSLNLRHDYDYGGPAVRNTRYDDNNRLHRQAPLSFSPWTPETYSSYNRRGY